MTAARALIFSGHVVDAPGRTPPRLPPARVPAAAAAIAARLAQLEAGPRDTGFTQGAAGGDLLFAEACLARGVPLQLLLPQPEDAFVRGSILPSADGAAWLARWQALRQAVPPALLPAGEGNPYERCNEALLAQAQAAAPGAVHLLALWDGAPGGPGGTAHMVALVRAAGGRVHWIDTRTLPDAP